MQKRKKITFSHQSVGSPFYSKQDHTTLTRSNRYIGLISINNSQVKIKALQQMLSYLVHAFPRVKYSKVTILSS